jgi:hypothetical protein
MPPATTPPTGTPPVDATLPLVDQILGGMPSGAQQLTTLCARKNNDVVSRALCATPAPTIQSLADLQKTIGLDFASNPKFVLSGHSSSLVVRSINAINPRAILFTPRTATRTANPNFVAMGFARGEQFAELAANDSTTNSLNFFLVRIQQACNAASGGCTLADVLTPAAETGWTQVTVYQDSDLKNTVLDCLQCHQPAGPGTAKMLRMQELRDPWTHFFRNNRPGGQQLLADYALAHPATETYAGIPGASIRNSNPADLENAVRDQGFGNQPNEFPTSTIQNALNTNPNVTPAAWLAIYQNVLNGTRIPVPFSGVRVTDATKLPTAAQGYLNVVNGSAAPSTMPDIRDIFAAQAERDMSVRPATGLTGAGIMAQMCERCHNSQLDQTISRARFNVATLATMSRAEKDVAIYRVGLGANNKLKMPPDRFGTLSPDEIQLVVTELQK